VTTRLDHLLRDTLTELADEARPAANPTLARTALRRAGRMRARRRAGTAAAVAVAVLAAGGLGSSLLPEAGRRGPSVGASVHATPELPASGPLTVAGRLVVLAARSADGRSTIVYDRAHDRYTRVPSTDVVPAPAGNRVAVQATRPEQLTIVDLTTGISVPVFGEPARWPVSWSPDGRQLAVLALGTNNPDQLMVIDAVTGASRTVASLDPSNCGEYCFATWHPDGSELAVAVQRGLQLYAVEDGHQTRLLPVHGGVAGLHDWSPDQRYVVVDGQQHRTQVVQVATGTVVGTLPGADAKRVYWSGPGRLAVPQAGGVDLYTPDGHHVDRVPLPPDFAPDGPVVLTTL